MDSNNNSNGAQKSSMVVGSSNNTGAQKGSMVVITGDRGEIQLPPGYKFKPDDSDLLVHYLKKIILNQPMTFRIEFLMDLYTYTPDQLFYDESDYYVNNARYFFTNKYTTENQASTEEGSWKVIPDSLKAISVSDQLVGCKQKLLFHWTTDQPKDNCFFLYEYRATIHLFASSEINDDIHHKISNTVVCKVVRGDCEEDSDDDDNGDSPALSDDDNVKIEDDDDNEIDCLNTEIRETSLQT